MRAKTEIFEHIRPGAGVILNGDDDKLVTVSDAGGNQPLFYGKGKQNSIYLTDVKNLGLKGMEGVIHTPQGEIGITIPIPGEHNLYNAMAAAAVGLHLGLTLGQIRQGIADTQTIAGRSNLIEANGLLIIDDCYNANPMSMKASLDVLHYGLGRRVALLGDMGELGKEEKQLHYEVGVWAARVGIDLLVCVGELAAEMERGARENLPGDCPMVILYYPNRNQLQEALPGIIKKGDTILVKASHFMGFTEVVKQLQG